MSVKPVAVLIHVHSLAEAREWYKKAFPMATEIHLEKQDFVSLDIDGFTIELVHADQKVSSGKAGSVLYWAVAHLDKAISHFVALGSTVYRGPMAIEDGLGMCQVTDPFGNLIGLRGSYDNGDSAP